MPISKRESYLIEPKFYTRGIPIKFNLHYEGDVGGYVFCYSTFFYDLHFTEDMLEDMLKIIKSKNKQVNRLND
jgi:hypothetical protein